MNITKNTLRVLRGAIDRALVDVGKEYDISLSLGNAKYTDVDFTFQLKGEVNETADGLSVAEKQFHEFSAWFGLTAKDYGRTFLSNGKTFSISGIKPNNRKYPILASHNGQTYKFTADAIKRHLGAI